MKITGRLLQIVLCLAVAAILAGCSSPSAPAPAPTVPPPSSPPSSTPVSLPPASTVSITPPSSPSPLPTTTPPSSTLPTVSSTPTSAPTSATWPTTVYAPTAAPYKPTGAPLEIFQYALDLINKDRAANNLPAITLDYNAAAQKHAQDMFDSYYSSHWGTDGLKPYMRYTTEGGLNYEAENSAYSGWYNPADNPANYNDIDVRQEIATLEDLMMNHDEAANWGHKANILDKWAKQVSLGIVYDAKRVALVQQFEGQYVEYYTPTTLAGNTLSFSGRLTPAGASINNISVAFDATPQPLTNTQLVNDPAYTDGYGLGNRVSIVIKPPEAGQSYSNLSPEAVIAAKWIVDTAGHFSIQADLTRALGNGKGVYTIVVVAEINGANVNVTNYSIFVR